MDVDKVVILPGTIILKVLEIHECRRIKSMREYYVKGKRVGIANVTEEDCKLSYENLKEDKEMLQENFSYNFDSNIINFEDYKNSHFERRGNIYRGFSIIRLEDSNVIGRVFGLIYEYNKFCLSFYLYNKYRNNGYGSEALELLRKYFLEDQNFKEVYGVVIPGNLVSIKSFEKAGFFKDMDMIKDRVVMRCNNN